ncbi:MAG: preprotein translocase subunit YajC [Lentisphaeria bacterium]|nr:preprotein translocase subunit YajC [Lentisphaeria bacterium]
MSLFFLQSAVSFAQAAAPKGGGVRGSLGSYVPFILLFVVLYLLMIRPQQKKQREHRELVSRVKVGDEVVTNSGIYGTISGVEETSVMLRVSEKVEIKLVRSAISAVVTDTESKEK